MIPKNINTQISVALIWLFHVCGVLGILFGNRELFIAFTPVNLFLTFMLLFVNQPKMDAMVVRVAGIAFGVGLLAEILGVNYGLIFGNYIYGENLGVKVFGVPLLIGVNWIVLTFITGATTSRWISNPCIAGIVGALLMVVLDLFIEPVAPKFDFWSFDTPTAPFQNYLGWFLVALPIQWAYHFYVKEKDSTFSYHLLIIQFLFFGTFALL